MGNLSLFSLCTQVITRRCLPQANYGDATAESLFRQNLNRELAEVKRLEEEGERALEGVMERGEEWSAAKISFRGT